tara:strand:+ start:1383 stop:3746 length:2364 start_codon:yes stop_codon:yes gene_type:complete
MDILTYIDRIGDLYGNASPKRKVPNPETRIQELATGGVATPKRGLVDESGSYGGKIPFTKKQQEIAETFAKKQGISVNELTAAQRKNIRDGMYTLESLKETKQEKNLKAGRVRKLNNLKEFKPINPNTKKVYTEDEWLSLKRHQRTKALNLTKDAEGYKQRLKINKRKTYLNNREKIINKVMDYYYEGGGKEKARAREGKVYKEGPLKGKGGILQADNNRLLKYMSVAAEYENPKFEIYEEDGKFAGVRDTDKNIIYRDHRYKGNKGVPITAHPDYKNTMVFAKTAEKFKYDRPDKLLGSYFAKYERVPTYAEMYNFFQRDPRMSAKTKVQNPLELHHMATMEKYPTKSYQLALFDKNTSANRIINDYNTPGSDAYKNKALADKRLKKLNIKLKIGGEFLGGGAKTAGGALSAAKTKTTAMFKTELAKNPKLVEEMTSYLKIIGCPNNKAMGGRIGFQSGTTCLTKGVDAINSGKIAKGAQSRNAAKFLNRAYKLGRGVMKFGVIPEALFLAGESLVRMGMGDTLDEALLRSIDWITPGDQTRKADLKMLTRTIGLENAQTVLRANDYKESLKRFNDAKVNAEVDLAQNMEEFSGMSDQEVRKLGEEKIAKAEADMKAKFQPEAVMDYAAMQESEAEDIRKSNSKFRKFIEKARQNQIDDIETIQAPEKVRKAADPMFTMDDLANIISDKFLKSEQDRMGAPELKKRNLFDYYRAIDENFNKDVWKAIMEGGRSSDANRERLFGTQGTFGGQPLANGGIASLTRTTPPERGPQHMGLDYLRKHGRGY